MLPCLLQVKAVNGSSILRLLKGLGLAPEIPEDLYHLIKKAVSMRKHLELFRKDKDGKFRLILVESRIHRLARYYRVRISVTVHHGIYGTFRERRSCVVFTSVTTPVNARAQHLPRFAPGSDRLGDGPMLPRAALQQLRTTCGCVHVWALRCFVLWQCLRY